MFLEHTPYFQDYFAYSSQNLISSRLPQEEFVLKISNLKHIHHHNREHKRFFAELQMTIFPKLTFKMSCKLICKKMCIYAIYCVSYMIFNMLFTKL